MNSKKICRDSVPLVKTKIQVSVEASADNEESLELNPIDIGFGAAIPEAIECPTFVPIQHELQVLLKHWLTVLLADDYAYAAYAAVGFSSCDLWIHEFARRRLARLTEFIEEQEGWEIRRQVEADLADKLGSENWKAFTSGELTRENDSNAS